MALTKGKHNIVEIDGIRCTLVETGVTAERLEFLKNLLSFNKFSVKSEQEKAKDGTLLNTFFIGVTDILFNPAIALYQKKMFRPDGEFDDNLSMNKQIMSSFLDGQLLLPLILSSPFWLLPVQQLIC